MKIKEIQVTESAGFGGQGGLHLVRIRKLAKGEAVPDGAVEVAEDTPEHDWTEEK